MRPTIGASGDATAQAAVRDVQWKIKEVAGKVLGDAKLESEGKKGTLKGE